MDAAAKHVGDRGKKELPIKEGDLATFVITLALTALNFREKKKTITLLMEHFFWQSSLINENILKP